LSFTKNEIDKIGSIVKIHTPRTLYNPKSYIGQNNDDRFSFIMSPLDSDVMLKFKVYRERGYFGTTVKMIFEDTREFVICAEKKWALTN